MEGELPGAVRPGWIQATLAGGIGGLHKAEGWGREGDAHHHSDVAMEPDRHHPLSLALSCRFRQIGDVAEGPIWRRQSCKTSIRSEDRGPKMLGTTSQTVDA
jgi:hypothetical protein